MVAINMFIWKEFNLVISVFNNTLNLYLFTKILKAMLSFTPFY